MGQKRNRHTKGLKMSAIYEDGELLTILKEERLPESPVRNSIKIEKQGRQETVTYYLKSVQEVTRKLFPKYISQIPVWQD